jgi:hypothetical protein
MVAGLAGCGDETAAGPPPAYDAGVVFAIGTTVHLESGESVEVDDELIWSVELTSVGPLVAHGRPDGEGGGSQRYSLVAEDGSVRRLGIDLDNTVGSSVEPDSAHLAYPAHGPHGFQVVVHDVARDREIARVAVPQVEPEPYLLWLDGDTVYVPNEAGSTMAVRWRTGEVTETGTPPGGNGVWSDVRGGLASYRGTDSITLHDIATGAEALSVRGAASFDLSPTGRYAAEANEGGRSFDVYDVATHEQVSLPGDYSRYGWTADDRLFRIRGDRLTICSPADGECTSSPLDVSLPRHESVVPGGRESW